MSTTALKIGPADHGRRMSLDDFDRAEVEPGCLYELSRGVISVVEVPHPRHGAQVDAARTQLVIYQAAHPSRIHRIWGGGECKILVAGLDFERHPDIALYKTRPPAGEDDVWSRWIPEIVVEVVSPSSRHRDYDEKPEEYLALGMLEVWLLDAEKGELLVLRRSRGRWAKRVVRPPQRYRTRLLPGFDFDCGAVFEAARE